MGGRASVYGQNALLPGQRIMYNCHVTCQNAKGHTEQPTRRQNPENIEGRVSFQCVLAACQVWQVLAQAGMCASVCESGECGAERGRAKCAAAGSIAV